MQVIWRGPQGGTVFVDGLRACPKAVEWKWPDSCRLYTLPGWLEDLHVFAQSIGLRREWFQSHATMPHYDLTEVRRRRAIELGAVAATRRDVAMVIRCWRDSQNARKGDVLRQEFATAAEELLKMSGRRGLPCLSLDEAHRYVERCKASLGQKGVQA